MAKFKVVISDPETGKSNVIEVEGSRAVPMIGRRIGETLDGSIVGLSGHKVLITGGVDRAGFPMRPSVHGGVKSSILLRGGVGYHPGERGKRRRKTVRGNTITEDISQVNIKITERPKKKPQEAAEPPETSKKTKKAEASEAA